MSRNPHPPHICTLFDTEAYRNARTHGNAKKMSKRNAEREGKIEERGHAKVHRNARPSLSIPLSSELLLSLFSILPHPALLIPQHWSVITHALLSIRSSLLGKFHKKQVLKFFAIIIQDYREKLASFAVGCANFYAVLKYLAALLSSLLPLSGSLNFKLPHFFISGLNQGQIILILIFCKGFALKPERNSNHFTFVASWA